MSFGTAGATLGERYELRKLLGSGGFGEVWEARDSHRNLLVALKLLRGTDRRGAWQEATVLTALRSPYILEVHNADMIVDVPFLDTALARASFDQIVGPSGIEPHRAVECARRLLRGLELCHSRGLFHRDVKPANVFEDFNGDVRLGDFGAATLFTANGGSVLHEGDPRVRAPESYNGLPFSIESDVYGAAVTLYCLLTGRWPFDQTMQADLDEAIRNGNAPKVRDLAPHVSSALARVLSRGMHVDPATRIHSAAEFDTLLGRLPQRRNRFTPIPSHPGHARCWQITGDRELDLCSTTDGRTLKIEIRHSRSGRRVPQMCSTVDASRALPTLRSTFDQLR